MFPAAIPVRDVNQILHIEHLEESVTPSEIILLQKKKVLGGVTDIRPTITRRPEIA